MATRSHPSTRKSYCDWLKLQICFIFFFLRKIGSLRLKLGQGEAYGNEEAIGARIVEVENVEEISGEVGDGAVLRLEKNPASSESIGPL